MNDLKYIIKLISEGKHLSESQAEFAFSLIMAGRVDLSQMAAFVMGLRINGETVDEITGGAKVLRKKADSIPAPAHAIDTCGTGGDNLGTYNISTAAAIVAAACGITVAKHGNRSISSKSGSADVLMALGLNLEITQETHKKSLETMGISFMFAPSHHKAMRHVAPVRSSLGIRSIFNVLGPLANPAKTKRQVLGVYDKKWLRPLAEVLQRLGSEHVWVVHGADGLDELTTTNKSYVASLKDGVITEFTVTPEDAGLSYAKIEDIQGGDAAYNAKALQAVLNGERNPYRDIVLLNTAAALIVGEKAETLKDGVAIAQEAIDTGKAAKLLEQWVLLTQKDIVSS